MSRAWAFVADMAAIVLALVVLAIIAVTVAPIVLWRIIRGMRT